MIDHKLIIAECRAGELLSALQSAVNQDPHWRHQARMLLREIEQLHLPEPATAALRELDARKRALEFADDIVREYHHA